jgi:hypothetical protein
MCLAIARRWKVHRSRFAIRSNTAIRLVPRLPYGEQTPSNPPPRFQLPRCTHYRSNLRHLPGVVGRSLRIPIPGGEQLATDLLTRWLPQAGSAPCNDCAALDAGSSPRERGFCAGGLGDRPTPARPCAKSYLRAPAWKAARLRRNGAVGGGLEQDKGPRSDPHHTHRQSTGPSAQAKVNWDHVLRPRFLDRIGDLLRCVRHASTLTTAAPARPEESASREILHRSHGPWSAVRGRLLRRNRVHRDRSRMAGRSLRPARAAVLVGFGVDGARH